MNSSTFLAVASAALFVLVFQGGEAADVVLEYILRSKRDLKTDDSTAISDTEHSEHNATQHTEGKISCMPNLTKDDYVIVPGVGAYKFHTSLTSWDNARKICSSEGGQLAVMDTQQKYDLFQKWRQEHDYRSIWVGFNDLFEEGKWVTMTGKSMDSMGYNPWAKDEPSGVEHLDADCAMLFADGLGDWVCSDPMEGFICEIHLCKPDPTPKTNISDA